MAGMLGDRQTRLREALADSDVFGSLTDEEIDRLIAYGNPVRHPKNRSIFQKDDPGDSLMVVLSGRVKISNVSAEGKEAVLNFIEPGRSFGELALFDGKPRSADATAIEPCELFVLRRADVLTFIERHPEVAFRAIGVLCERVRRTSELLEDSITLTMPARLARGLLRLAKVYGRTGPDGVRIELKLSQRELGGYIGLARENINRQLMLWRQDGVLAVEDGRIVILDVKALQRIADSGA
jgi:CRP/FNR family cyclic AMP-dependent transcriptional regulator